MKVFIKRYGWCFWVGAGTVGLLKANVWGWQWWVFVIILAILVEWYQK